MSLAIKGILVCNHLNSEIQNVRIRYAESIKSCNSSYLYDFRTVDVETEENVYWTKTVDIDENIPENQESLACEHIRFGNNRGYWQVYFTYEKNSYKINKNNAMMNLWDIDNGKIVTVTVLHEGKKIRLNFEVESGKAHFYAEVGKPILRGASVEVWNDLDQELTDVAVLYAESLKNIADITTDTNVIWKQKLKFSGSIVPPTRYTTTTDSLVFGYNKHFWQVYFTYGGKCYKLIKDNTSVNLTGKDNGQVLKITVASQDKKDLHVEFHLNGKVEIFLAKVVRTVEERIIEIHKLGNFLERKNVAARCTYNRSALILSLRNVACELRLMDPQEDKHSPSIIPDDQTKLFYEIPHPRPRDLDIVDDKNNTLLVTELLSCESEIVKLIKAIKCQIDEEKKQSEELKTFLKEVDDLFNGVFITHRPYDTFLLGFGIALDRLSFVGINELGLTVRIGSQLEVGIFPDRLATVLEEELELLEYEAEDEPYRMHVLCYNALMRELDVFSLVRMELIKSLRDVAVDLHEKNKNVNISWTTASAAGIVGGGLVVAGVILEPFTAGLSTGLVVAGIGTAAASGVTAVGTSIVDTVLTQKLLEKIKMLMEDDRILAATLRDLEELLDFINQAQARKSDTCQPNVVACASNVASEAGIVAVKTGFQVLKNTALKFGSAMVGIAFDLVGICDQTASLARGAKSELGYKLENDSEELEKELEQIQSVISLVSNDVVLSFDSVRVEEHTPQTFM